MFRETNQLIKQHGKACFVDVRAAFLLGEHAKFITGTDLLIDGGVIAAIRMGEYQLG